ncbi:hypothetical protein [Microbacterium sp. UFMG61]|uniref:hypothetical protein n=1 Tax=Microbacterium sp. UFMG61 TaxID=2745935 RepID=UPI00188E2D91|nr:hypothetical protein [Microbacterium sp. UFMG61]
MILTGSDAALLYQVANIRRLRIAARGKSDRLYALLTDITEAAFIHAASVDGKNRGKPAESDESQSNDIVSVEHIARRAGVTARTVRNHIGLGLITAEKVNRTWLITREAAQQYIDGRTAA